MQDAVLSDWVPAVALTLEPHETVLVHPGALAWLDAGVRLTTTTGGLGPALLRRIGGGPFWVTAATGPGRVVLTGPVPGRVQALDLAAGEALLAARHAILAYTPSCRVTVGFQQSFLGGLWGGDGFVLERVDGPGRLWLALGGEPVTTALAPGETVLVHPGLVGAFDVSVQFALQPVPSLSTILFGQTGPLFVALTGPGTVVCHTGSPAWLAAGVAPYLGLDSRS
jgi:uncharacterized protein (AIM24 family)